jgi:hypothetical protein
LPLFLQGHQLYVTAAPDPEQIIWEHMKYTPLGRAARQLLTFLLGLLLVVICLFIVAISLGYDKDVADKGGTDVCPAHYDAWREEVKESYVENNPGSLHCYCDQYPLGKKGEGCGQYYQALTVARLFRAATAVCICGCALLVDALLWEASQHLEKPTATEGQETSIMRRSFVLKTILYGLLFLFTLGHYDMQANYNEPELRFNFTPEWYNGTGQALILTMLLNVFSPHLCRVYQYLKFRLKQRNIEKNGRLVFTQVWFMFCV